MAGQALEAQGRFFRHRNEGDSCDSKDSRAKFSEDYGTGRAGGTGRRREGPRGRGHTERQSASLRKTWGKRPRAISRSLRRQRGS